MLHAGWLYLLSLERAAPGLLLQRPAPSQIAYGRLRKGHTEELHHGPAHHGHALKVARGQSYRLADGVRRTDEKSYRCQQSEREILHFGTVMPTCVSG